MSRGSLALFLALYLLLLAFFIMLNALSTLESRRAEAVMDSLTLTFSDRPKTAVPTSGSLPLDYLDARARAAEAFIALVTEMFQTAAPAARVVRVAAGRSVELDMRAIALFAPDEDRIPDARLVLLDSIVAALAAAPAGMRFEMAVVFNAGEEETLPTGPDALALRRAGTMGRTMAARGAEPGSVVVGLAEGDPDWVRLTFRVVDVEAWNPDFRDLPADAVPIDAQEAGGDDAVAATVPAPAPAGAPRSTQIGPSPGGSDTRDGSENDRLPPGERPPAQAGEPGKAPTVIGPQRMTP